jgi:phosphoserine/homoserine phosphotransferase
MSRELTIVAADLEGVFTPEVWIAVSEKTGIEKLRLTTRDVPDYDKLMQGRLQILREHGLKLRDIQAVIQTLQPLPGAVDFVNWVRSRTQLIVLSDTYAEFAAPLMAKLGYPTLFCNWLEVDEDNSIVGYHIRKRDGKKHAVIALKGLGFQVIAIGDSYNDTTMLAEADVGLLFRPPQNVIAEFPQFQVTREYGELKESIEKVLG